MCSAEMKQGKNGQNFKKMWHIGGNSALTVFILNINGQLKADFIKLDSKQKPSMFCVQQTHFACKVLDRLNLKI